MNTQPTPKVIGAFVIGFALVAGAYVFSNFGKPIGDYTQNVNTAQQVAAVRNTIEVTDENNNGIEDWRDEFVDASPIIAEVADDGEPYVRPETITGQAGINFFEDMVRSRSYGGDDNLVLESTFDSLAQQTSIKIYDTPDINILTQYDGQSIRTYANTLATAIMENNQSDLDFELLILQDILNRRDESRFAELRELAEIYRLTRDAVIEIPVPGLMAKEHLDFINTLHAVHHDILAMTYSYDDPAYSLLRLKRYEGDVFGMIASLENIYVALEPHANLFNTDDPAIFFVQFSPANRNRL